MRALPQTDTLLGQDALGVVRVLARQLPSVTFSFLRYAPSPSVGERVLGGHPCDIETLPTVELASLLARQPELAAELIRHEPGAEETRTLRLGSAAVLSDDWPERVNSLPEEEVWGIRSECTLEGGTVFHLPLMDFRVGHGPFTVAGLQTAVQHAAPWGGLLLDSGRSFHLYGAQLLTSAEWVRFMGQCLLLSPLADPRYVGHRLLSGFGVLRLTTSPRKPMAPRVVAAF